MDFQNFDGVPTLTFDQLSFCQFSVFAVPPPHKGEVHLRLNPQCILSSYCFFLFFHLFLSLLLSLDLEGGDVVISIEPVRYATYVYLPVCSTRSGRPLLATSGPPSSLLLVLYLAPRVRLLSVAPNSSSFVIMY